LGQRLRVVEADTTVISFFIQLSLHLVAADTLVVCLFSCPYMPDVI